MRFVRSFSSLALAFVFLFHSILLAAPGSQKKSNGPRLLWAFGAIRASSNPPKVEPVRTKMVLSSGDKLKMMIQLRRKCFVYLIHRDSQGDFTMLFPYSLKQFDTDYQTARNYYAPKGEAWFQLDSRTGNETFYLIASDQRLLDIEYTYEKYASSEESKKQNLAGQMLSELNMITETHLASSEGVEKLADKESVLRGFERATGADPTDIVALAREISFDNIYSETFVVDHR
ncbi:MAG TPA: DUF4384 domain-containing protein [Deltaproteobacteria bacterium]|jgi:hypothetical protein|nr:DUF4384 domain-containing protein [Deltaproteobacteria bacterium]HIJ76196.1 DUF4384 domain-containing protein [Deltaproteobacteria bacterium]